eukprot:9315728-Pyramimonas_sp.AAC.1
MAERPSDSGRSSPYGRLRKYAQAARRWAVPAKLQRAGPQAAAVYGHHVHGQFGSVLHSQRRRLGAAA